MIGDMEFVELSMELAKIEQRKAEIIELMKPYVLENGDQKIGKVEAKVKVARRQYDYEATWNKHSWHANIDIEEYKVQPPQPPQPAAYYDYMTAVRDAEIESKYWVVKNEEAVNNPKVDIKVNL